MSANALFFSEMASSSFIKTYTFNHTSCLLHSWIHLYTPKVGLVEAGSSLVSHPPPTEVSRVSDSSGSRIWLTLLNYWISNGN